SSRRFESSLVNLAVPTGKFMAHTLVSRPVQLVLLSRRERRTMELYMGLKIACQSIDRTLCVEVFGTLTGHLDSLAKYVKAKAVRRNSVLIDIRGVTKRPGADKLFIHALKYPSICSCKIALVDFQENRTFCLLFQRLLQTRGYQICSFSDEETARSWLLTGRTLSATKERFYLTRQILTAVKYRLNPIRLSHVTTGSQ